MEYLLAQQAAEFAALDNARATSANEDEVLECAEIAADSAAVRWPERETHNC
jgi:hypothetical protein